jgi:hypothetical protein
MKMSKNIEMKTERVIKALKDWSPRGLCGGTLVQKNGEKANTEACAIGCLTMEFATSRRGREFFQKTGKNRKNFLHKHIYGNGTVPNGKFRQAMQKYFGIDQNLESAMMSYNDSCVEADGGTDEDPDMDAVPTQVRKTIYSLRKRYEKFVAKWEEKYGDKYAVSKSDSK